MTDDLKQRRARVNASTEAAMYRRFNTELVTQLAAANARIRMLEDRLRGDSSIRRIAALTGTPQSVVLDVLYKCVEERVRHDRQQKALSSDDLLRGE